MKLALILNVIDPAIGGVLIMGHRGTAKSTAVRALPGLLPEITAVKGCPYHCDPNDEQSLCYDCKRCIASGEKFRKTRTFVPVVDLPLGATEDRICGTIDIERALQSGAKAFEPGLLARANRGFLYIDEVNLLEDHLVDLLLDVAVTGTNRIERESISFEHPARFILIGSGNPEEGELRPQLIDRFGLHVEVKTETELEKRVEIIRRRDAYERDPESLSREFQGEQERLKKKIGRARRSIAQSKIDRGLLEKIAQFCSDLSVDGHRGELTIMRAARALSALEARRAVTLEDVKSVAPMAVRHRLRRDELEDPSSTSRIQASLDSVFAHHKSTFPKPAVDANTTGENRGSSLHVVETPSPAGKRGTDSKPHAPLPPISHELRSQIKLPNGPQVNNSVEQRVQSGRGSRRTIRDHQRGRYSGASPVRRDGSRVALDATLRAAAFLNSGGPEGRNLNVEALRYKRYARKSGSLYIFAIDTSGSMALNRINQARQAILGLLRQSYISRDRVAIISFRGLGAEIVLPPSRSILRARQALDSLAIGGGTPLTAGLRLALTLARRERLSNDELVLLLFTDGHVNVTDKADVFRDRAKRKSVLEIEITRLGAALKKAKVSSVIVDTQHQFRPTNSAREIAERLGARYLSL